MKTIDFTRYSMEINWKSMKILQKSPNFPQFCPKFQLKIRQNARIPPFFSINLIGTHSQLNRFPFTCQFLCKISIKPKTNKIPFRIPPDRPPTPSFHTGPPLWPIVRQILRPCPSDFRKKRQYCGRKLSFWWCNCSRSLWASPTSAYSIQFTLN